MTRAMSALALAVLLSGCGGKEVQYVPVTSSTPLCRAAEITCISRDDVLTEGTAQSIEGNNRGIAKACKKQVACKPEKPTS